VRFESLLDEIIDNARYDPSATCDSLVKRMRRVGACARAARKIIERLEEER
jgi:hypothetical protein